uniref:Uncharacterized protein n=1 Tax=Arundo donax TaxID=35708 RepID=A0A0A9EPE2_ARUDO
MGSACSLPGRRCSSEQCLMPPSSLL